MSDNLETDMNIYTNNRPVCISNVSTATTSWPIPEQNKGIDYKALLTKYVKTILDVESWLYLGDFEGTDEEKAELSRIFEEWRDKYD